MIIYDTGVRRGLLAWRNAEPRDSQSSGAGSALPARAASRSFGSGTDGLRRSGGLLRSGEANAKALVGGPRHPVQIAEKSSEQFRLPRCSVCPPTPLFPSSLSLGDAEHVSSGEGGPEVDSDAVLGAWL